MTKHQSDLDAFEHTESIGYILKILLQYVWGRAWESSVVTILLFKFKRSFSYLLRKRNAVLRHLQSAVEGIF